MSHPLQEIEGRDEVEVSPEATVLMGEVATRLEQAGGAMLIIDYGHNGTKGDTFRVRRHLGSDCLFISNLIPVINLQINFLIMHVFLFFYFSACVPVNIYVCHKYIQVIIY